MEDSIIQEVSHTSTDQEYVIESITAKGKFSREQVNTAIRNLIKDGMLQKMEMDTGKVFLRVTRKED